MLAEKRKKVFYSNPRGTLWANDDQKFGQRLLKSMGWKEGKGSGQKRRRHHGQRQSFKFDSQGFGYKRKLNHWIEENNVYEQILSDLAQQHGGSQAMASQESTASAEIKPKSSKVKHHHRSKFIKAKNLSLQSQKDLFCIFPTTKKVNENDPNTPKTEQSPPPKSEVEEDKAEECTPMVTLESKLSIQEYFKQKMKSRMFKTNNPTDDESSPPSQQDCQQVPTQENVEPETNDHVDDTPSEPVKSKHKRKKHKHKH